MDVPKNSADMKSQPSSPMGATTSLPTHEVVYRDLRRMILFGDLAPGQAVTIQGLRQSLNAGMTPVREAIRRMTAAGALNFQGNRRAAVPILTPENIDEIIVARQAIEPELTRLACDIATPDDLGLLESIDQKLDQAILHGDVKGYLELNYRFHAKIYQLANAPILSNLVEGLWLRFGPSLRVVCGRIGTQNLPDRHKEAMRAMRAGDGKLAADAIRQDVVQGMEQVRAAIANKELR